MPAPLVEIASSIVPPGERPRVIESGEHVFETPVLDVAQGGPFGLAHVGHADKVGRVPDVPVGRRHVEVAADRHR